MLTRSQPVDSDDFGETIARFAAPAERSFLERRGAAELQMRRIALMTRAQRLYSPESTVVDVRPAQAQPRWADTSGLARCHGAADELQNGCVQKTGCLKVILEKTIGMASVPDWSEMWHSDNIHQSANRTQNDEKKDEKKTRVVTTYSVTNGVITVRNYRWMLWLLGEHSPYTLPHHT